MHICFYCEQEIKEDEPETMIGVDIPYVNIWFHRTELRKITDLNSYLAQNAEKIYNYREKSDEIRKTNNAKRRLV